MSKIPLKINKYSSSELKSFLRKDEKFQQGVRLYACYHRVEPPTNFKQDVLC
jgi:hypothetical protein